MRRGLVLVLSAACLTGCGGGSSSASSRLQTRAARICTAANRRLEQDRPRQSHYQAFLGDGLAVLEPELRRLKSVRTVASDQAVYADALGALGREITEVKRTLSGLDHHQDPALAFAALQRRLAPLESQANAAWRALQIPACVNR
ncbi:MAG TPA: hypothetical protein VMD09_08160 [Solirubrobacteraceae bacterium]|nr:hypothetical protein [Solirubrobacteraceae bacterium]